MMKLHQRPKGPMVHSSKPSGGHSGEILSKLFTSSEPENFDEILEQIPTMVTNDMNKQLLEEFIVEEVEDTLKQMTPLKSLGPNGMSPLFYQSYWSLVGTDVTKAILLY